MLQSMKTMLCTLFTLTASILISRAEITDKTMGRLQETSSEKLTIKVQKITENRLMGGIKYTLEAKVTAVTESATDLKVGDDIVIRYRVSKAPGSYPGKVEEGKSYMAYLSFDPKRGDQVYDSAAGRGTFMAVD